MILVSFVVVLEFVGVIIYKGQGHGAFVKMIDWKFHKILLLF